MTIHIHVSELQNTFILHHHDEGISYYIIRGGNAHGILNHPKFDNTVVLLCFETVLTDKYGNETKSYEDFKIAVVPTMESAKYKAGEFFDASCHITDNIRKAAFGNIEKPTTIDFTTDTVPSVNISTQELKQAEEDWEQWLKQRNSE